MRADLSGGDDSEADDSATTVVPADSSPISGDLSALVRNVAKAMEASRPPGRRTGRRSEWLLAAALLLALLAVEELRMGILRERAAQATERAERAERSEEQLSALLQAFTGGASGPAAPRQAPLLDVEDFERKADRADLLAAVESGARLARGGRELSKEEILEILDSLDR